MAYSGSQLYSGRSCLIKSILIEIPQMGPELA